MERRRFLAAAAMLCALALVAASCGGGEEEEKIEGEAKKGGTLRVGITNFSHTGGFDPTAEYLGTDHGLYHNLLLRTLLTGKNTLGAEGNELVPDLAEALPEVSTDGLTYTFKLREGIRFGPPVNREITSKDVEYAFKRIGTPGLAAYGFWYGATDTGSDVIKGIRAFFDAGGLTSEGASIEGIQTPDDRTIVFTLARPFGDFIYRITLPAAAPIPEEVAKCFSENAAYGRFFIASGPYMIEGSEDLDISSCDAMKPISGFDPTRSMTFVRNPNYDPKTDDPSVRPAYPDRVEYTINTNIDDIFAKIEAGELELSIDSPPPQVIQKYTTTEALKDRIKTPSADRIWYLTMNLTQPPFDDVNVRKAVNFVMDKTAMQRAWGGPTAGRIATHILPPEMLADKLGADYDPYASADFAGDVEKAKEAMRQSRYDTDKDGLCDASACKGVLHVARNTPPQQNLVPIVESSLRKIGITVRSREISDHYGAVHDASTGFGISSNEGWGKDYPDPVTYYILFDGRSLTSAKGEEAAAGNTSFAGLSPGLATRIGIDLPANHPSIDADIDRCGGLAGDERLDCWVELTRKTMEEVVPWVPYLWANDVNIVGPAVTNWDYDQLSGENAFAKVAVDPAKQK